MYTEYFGLSEKPFAITPNPAFLFLSKNHKDAFAHLLYGIRQRVGFIELTGEVGTGKTTVLRTLLNQLDTEDYRLAFIFNPSLSSLELLQSINREYGLPAESQSAADLHAELNRFLLEENRAGRTVVLVIDEAQNLRPEVLEQIRLLSNLETETDKLIQILLVGQPELGVMLEAPNLRQLSQRITVRYRLGPMDAADTGTYIRHRLEIASYRGGELFPQGVVQRIYRLSKGFPRLINVLCDRALLIAYAEKLRQVTPPMIRQAEREMSRQVSGRKLTPTLRWLVPVGGLALLLLILGWQLLAGQAPLPSSSSAQDVPVSSREEGVDPPKSETAAARPAVAVSKQVARWREWLTDLAERGSAESALLAVLEAWQTGPVSSLEGEWQLVSLRKWAMQNGLEVTGFQGRLDDFLQHGVPAVAECLVPGSTGRRFLALLGLGKDGVVVAAGPDGSGYESVEVLQGLWSGRGYLLWKNHDNLPFVNSPGESGAGVKGLQQLLRKAGFAALPLSGRFDRETIEAVTEFQRSAGIAQDGRIGPQTLLLLYRAAGYPGPHVANGGRV